MRVANLPATECPHGAGAEDNQVLRVENFTPEDYGAHQRVPHWDFTAEMGLLDVERATKLSGAMFAMFRREGAMLARALVQFALDRNADRFEEVRPPTLVHTDTMTSTGHLPRFADDAYHLERDDLWAIPTAEVPLTSLCRDEVLAEADLPMRLMAHTSCFRREAGAAGRDTRGLLRVHEFDKVEILAYATPEQAPGGARRVAGAGRGRRGRPGSGLPDRGHLHRRPGRRRGPDLRRGGLLAGHGPLVGVLVGLLVQRLPGPAGQRPLPPRRHPRDPAGAHPERLGPGGAAGVGRAHRDVAPARRLHRGPPAAAPVHAGAGA